MLPFVNSSYRSENVLVAIGGAFNPDKILDQLSNLLGNWQSAARPIFADAPPAQTKQPVTTVAHGSAVPAGLPFVGGGHAGEQGIAFQAVSWYQSVY